MELETQTPQTVMETDSNPAAGDQAYFSVSTTKLKWLYLATFGLYGIYWFYKNWKLQQPYIDDKIMPVMRGIFSIFCSCINETHQAKYVTSGYSRE
ncbi:hypothetical protein GCM10025856_07570 [Methylophaga marina]|uniref:DUF4234 domain-containing protein n=1 Tax=Methylophaga marina TaxID=45495 RepID=A0ABP3CS76_9GAMM|nr:hypothetical protein [Methylophaga marina]BDZ73038.1 hypothetical protein GCM10025856_07570 [Methylophaga marina]